MHKKSILLSFFTVLGGVPFWFLYKKALLLGSFDSMYAFYAFLCITLFFLGLGLLLLLAETSVFILGTILISVAPVLYFFPWSPYVGGALLLMCISALYGHTRVREEIKNRLNFNVTILLRQGLPPMLTALSLLLASSYFVHARSTPALITMEDILSRHTFEVVFEKAGIYLGDQFMPGLDYDATIDDYIKKQLSAGGVNMSTLPRQEQERLIAEARKEFVERLKKDNTGVIITGDRKLKDVLYESLLAHSEQFLETYSRYVPVTLAVAFFLFLRTVAFPFGWIITWICFFLIHLSTRLGLVIRVEEDTRKERLEWA